MLVHNQSKSVHNLNGGIYLAPYAETYVAVSRKYISKELPPYSNCLSDLEPFSNYSRKIFGYFNVLNARRYDQELCINLCYQDKLITSCNCSSLIIEALNGTRYCETDTEIACENIFDGSFTSSNPDIFCEDVCRPECESQVFDYSISFSKFPTQDYMNLNPNETLLRFIVNYNDNTYTQVTESPATCVYYWAISADKCTCIGISFLSFVEIFEFFFELGVLYYRSIVS
jgi:hypothetical protein